MTIAIIVITIINNTQSTKFTIFLARNLKILTNFITMFSILKITFKKCKCLQKSLILAHLFF